MNAYIALRPVKDDENTPKSAAAKKSKSDTPQQSTMSATKADASSSKGKHFGFLISIILLF